MAPIKSNKGPAPDFKRVKAKVGKRAPKPANLTDTSFKAASVTVRPQTVAPTAGASVELVTSRGRTILDLTTQLQHPAQAVRLSAAKGLRDLLLTCNADVLWNQLSVLVPTVAKCCVDAEDQVREVGLLSLKDFLAILGRGATTMLIPFGPLLIATLACALNSLDKDMRKHGAMAVQILCQGVPKLVAPHVAELLPAFIRLLSQMSLFRHRTSNESVPSATKKKTKLQSQEAEFSLASALLSLVSTVSTQAGSDDGLKEHPFPDLTIAERSQARNAFVLSRPRHPKRRLVTLDNGLDVSASFSPTQRRQASAESLVVLSKTAVDLMCCFRDVLIEFSQRELSAKKDMETLLLMCKSFLGFWEFGEPSLACVDEKEQASLEKVFRQIGKLIIEIFPLPLMASSRTLADELNACLCASLFVLSSVHGMEKVAVVWKKHISSHVLSALKSMQQEESTTELNGRVHVLRLCGKLLLQRDSQVGDTKDRSKLVKAFCQAFFHEGAVHRSLACSTVGQEAVRQGCALFELQHYEIRAVENEFGPHIVDVVILAPDYLRVWANNFVSESYRALTLLHRIAQRSDDRQLVENVTTKLVSLLTGDRNTTFELYPERSQRLLVSFFAMTGSLAAPTLPLFGQICIRSRRQELNCCSRAVVSFILQSFHTIRKQLPMQAYLTLVVDSTGVDACSDAVLRRLEPVHGADSRPWQAMMSYDLGLNEACQCYVDCGTVRVLQMIAPLLSTWLECSSGERNCDLVRLRAAVSMIALFNQDIVQYSGSSVWNSLSSDVYQLVCQAITNLLCKAPLVGQDKASNRLFDQWTRPARVLLSTDASLLIKVFADLCTKGIGLNSQAQTATMASISYLVNEAADLEAIVGASSAKLLELVESLSQSIPMDGPVKDQVARLSARLAFVSEQATA